MTPRVLCPTCHSTLRHRGEVRIFVGLCGCAIAPTSVVRFLDRALAEAEPGECNECGEAGARSSLAMGDVERDLCATCVGSAAYLADWLHEAVGHGASGLHPLREGAIAAWRKALPAAQRSEDDAWRSERRVCDVCLGPYSIATGCINPQCEPFDPTTAVSMVQRGYAGPTRDDNGRPRWSYDAVAVSTERLVWYAEALACGGYSHQGETREDCYRAWAADNADVIASEPMRRAARAMAKKYGEAVHRAASLAVFGHEDAVYLVPHGGWERLCWALWEKGNERAAKEESAEGAPPASPPPSAPPGDRDVKPDNVPQAAPWVPAVGAWVRTNWGNVRKVARFLGDSTIEFDIGSWCRLDQCSPWAPRVGERVRVNAKLLGLRGSGVVESAEGIYYGVRYDDGSCTGCSCTGCAHTLHELEPAQ